MRIGSLTLKSNLFLSPLAGYTNLPFRLTLREVGGLDLATTDLVNARSLLEKNRKALKLIETRPADQPAGGAIVRRGAGGNARRGGLPGIHRHRVGGHQHGLPGAQSVPRGRRLGDDDGTGQNFRAGPRDGQRRENSRHRQDAAGLGRRQSDRAGSGARAGGRGRGGDFCAWPHARAGIFRVGETARHPRRGAGGENHSRSSATATSPRPRRRR